MKKNLLILFFVFCWSSTMCQLTTFQKIYGGSNYDNCRSMRPTSDGGYIMTGLTTSFGNNSEVYLLKTDNAGNILWTKRYFDSNSGRGKSAWQTADSGFIITGTSFSFGTDIFLLKTDSMGTLHWYSLYDASTNEEIYSAIQTSDGGYIASGYAYMSSSFDVLLIKTDSNGNLVWSKTLGGSLADAAYEIRQTADAGFLAAGLTMSFGAGATDVYIIKLDSMGNYTWSKTYGSGADDYAFAMELTNDGGFITAGITYDSLSLMGAVYIIKSDSAGNVQWSKSYGNSSSTFTGTDIQLTSDGGYIIADTSDGDAGLIKIDSSGTLMWAKAYGTAGNEYVHSAHEATDGGFVTAGWTDGYTFFEDVYFVKTDSTGNCICNEATVFPLESNPVTIVTSPATVVNTPSVTVNTPIVMSGTGGTATIICMTVGEGETVSEQNIISVYPNPFTASTTITIYDVRFTMYDFKLYDVLGREVFVSELPRLPGGQGTPDSQLERGNLQSGIYFYKVTGDKGQGARGKGQGTGEIIGAGKLIIE